MARIYPDGCRACGTQNKESKYKPDCNRCTADRKAKIAARACARWYKKAKATGKTRVFSERAYRARRARLVEKKMSSILDAPYTDFVCRPNVQYFKMARCAEGVALTWGVLLTEHLPAEGAFIDVSNLAHLRVVAETPQAALLLAQEREARAREEK